MFQGRCDFLRTQSRFPKLARLASAFRVLRKHYIVLLREFLLSPLRRKISSSRRGNVEEAFPSVDGRSVLFKSTISADAFRISRRYHDGPSRQLNNSRHTFDELRLRHMEAIGDTAMCNYSQDAKASDRTRLIGRSSSRRERQRSRGTVDQLSQATDTPLLANSVCVLSTRYRPISRLPSLSHCATRGNRNHRN
jgi:hypothetical protein